METQNRWIQRYNLTTGFTLEPTDAITADVNLTYNRNQTTDLGYNETITPTADFTLSNDIFVAAWNGTYTQTRYPSAATIDTYTWEASLSNGWQREYWPGAKLYYNETGSNSDEQDIDLFEMVYGTEVTWSLPWLDLFYGYTGRQSEDRFNDNQVDETSHFARLETGGTFWNNRLSLKLIETFNHNNTDYQVGGGEPIEVAVSVATFGVADTYPGSPAFVDHRST